jgi:SNF2 family DNA or RNA helicase
LYHGLGTGKTCASIAVAQSFLAADKKVVVLAPASLRKNFEQEVIKCGGNEFTSDRNWMLNEKNEVVPSDGTDGIAFDALTDAQNLKPNSGYAIL